MDQLDGTSLPISISTGARISSADNLTQTTPINNGPFTNIASKIQPLLDSTTLAK